LPIPLRFFRAFVAFSYEGGRVFRPQGEAAMKHAVTHKTGQSKTPHGRVELGVKVLMLAVLEDALATYKRGAVSSVPSQQADARRVEAWAESNAADGPFAFLNVCRAAGASPAHIRDHMAAWCRRPRHEDETIN
jgi:hypothetical protein